MAQLRQSARSFEQLDTRVVIISFVDGYWAENWLRETESPFPVLLDIERRVYRAYGLSRSWRRAWGPKILWHYARRLVAGERWRGIQGDSTQLGGDMIVDRQGMIRLRYHSDDPTNRPDVTQLLDCVRRIAAEG